MTTAGSPTTEAQVTGTERGVTRYPRYDAAELGFENYWYPVMFSRTLRKRPIGLTLFGERIMFFRDRGRAYALHDRCPHRGIKLSIGRQEFPGSFRAAITAGPTTSPRACSSRR